MIFLAKCRPDQTYETHVWQVYLAWKNLIARHAALIERTCARHGVSKDRFLLRSLLTVALHDMGKLSVNFQRMMRAQTEAERHRAMDINFRHEYASIAFVRSAVQTLNRQMRPIIPKNPRFPLEALAVLGHHKTVDVDLSRFKREIDHPESLEWEPGSLEEGRRVAQKIFDDCGLTLPQIDFEKCFVFASQRPAFVHDLSPYISDIPSARDLFVLMKGLLMTADWCASSNNPSYQTGIGIGPEHVEPHLRKKVAKDGGTFSGFTTFQNACKNASGHVIAVAPTGSGKTEAALLWALEQIKHGHVQKLLYLLPTMVTANSLHNRMNRFFDKEHGHRVGLTHSMADLILRREEDQEESTEAESKRRSDLLFDRHFFPPVTVGTVDQLLTTLFHSGRWPLKTFAAQDAAIVIDEIHSYDPYTTGLIVKAIEQLGKTGARFMVMSATFPESSINIFRPVLEQSAPVQIIRDRELLQASRSHYRVIDGDLFDHQKMIRDCCNQGNRVLVVVNTVARCQELTKNLKDLDPICYHSKFILQDRQSKEATILKGNPSLVIATQVVEVALDIDFDVLFTECAPPDALAQRAGRINRKRKREGKVIIFQPGPGSERIYFDDTRKEQKPEGSLLARSFRVFSEHNNRNLTEQNLLDIVERVYANQQMQTHDKFKHATRLVEHDQNEKFYGVLDSSFDEDEKRNTRLEEYIQISVIPLQFRETVMALDHPKNRRLYELKMPAWYVKKNKIEEEDILFCDMKYNDHLGGQFAEETSLGLF